MPEMHVAMHVANVTEKWKKYRIAGDNNFLATEVQM